MKEDHIISIGTRIRKIIVFILFVCIIFLPMLENVLNISSEYENTENRTKAPLPKFDIEYLDPYPSEYENYFNDNHNFRGELLLLNSKFKFNILNISPVKIVVEGKNGWLYTSKYIESYINSWLFTNIELDSLYKIYSQRSKWLDEKGIKHYIAIVPNKAHVYPEFLPDRLKKSRVTKTDQFIKTLEKIPNLNVFYLRDALIEEKEKSPYNLFYKTDQHWNEYGAIIGVKKIVSEIKKDFPEMKDVELSDFIIDTTNTDGRGLARMLMLQKSIKEMVIDVNHIDSTKSNKIDTLIYPIPEVFPYKDRHQVYYSSNDKKLPKVLVIRDSFTDALIDKLPNSFSETTYIWDTWCYELHEDIVANEKPDIFLTIIIEANLPFIIYKHNSVREDGYIAIEPNKKPLLD